MARAETNKLYRTFVKGLVTEAGPLTYPEDASISESNTVLYRAGNRSRRLGIDLESVTPVTGVYTPDVYLNLVAINEYRWNSVNNNSGLTFIVQQIGLFLYFYSGNSANTAQSRFSFVVNMTGYAAPNVTNAEQCVVSFASGGGVLFVVGEKFEPFYVQYNETLGTVTSTRIYVQVRDFKGVSDNLANNEEPTGLSTEHHYNLLNQGWLDAGNSSGYVVTYFDSYGQKSTFTQPTNKPIADYFAQHGKYPGNNKQWWVAKDSTNGAFDPALLNTFYFGNNRAPTGHYVVDAFYIDRTAMSGVPGIPVEATRERPTSVAFSNSRAWYGVNNKIYFSQVMTDKSKAGMCYQEADPTSEDISDLIATDGGVIPIPEMEKLTKLVPSGAGMIVFANNGVWFIGGTQAGFTALDISVSKISPIGTESPGSIIEVDGSIYWWSKIGIMAMSQKQGLFGSVEGVFDRQNITEQTIQSFFNNISDNAKKYAKAVYDPATNIIQWLYKDDTITERYVYNHVLNLDLSLQAFYPWDISTAPGYPKIVGVVTTPNLTGYTGPLKTSVRKTFIKYSVMTGEGSNYRSNFAIFKDINFADWSSWNTGLKYTSYLETGYEILEDALRKKQIPWVVTYLKRTEENFIPIAGDYTVDRPSSCLFQVKWDWSSSSKSNKFSTKREIYRINRAPAVPTDLTFDTGFPVVVTKHKVRGSGKSIQFRFESDAIGSDFDLLGWAVNFAGNTKA